MVSQYPQWNIVEYHGISWNIVEYRVPYMSLYPYHWGKSRDLFSDPFWYWSPSEHQRFHLSWRCSTGALSCIPTGQLLETWTYIYIYIRMHAYTTLHCIALHCIAFHYITLQYIILHYIQKYVNVYIYYIRNIVLWFKMPNRWLVLWMRYTTYYLVYCAKCYVIISDYNRY